MKKKKIRGDGWGRQAQQLRQQQSCLKKKTNLNLKLKNWLDSKKARLGEVN